LRVKSESVKEFIVGFGGVKVNGLEQWSSGAVF
jgi:hypothetical protein